MWAAIIAAVAAIVGVIIQSSSNKDLAEYQADRNEDYLKQQQDYNSPESQMDRYQQAGLNPMLAVSGGNPGNQVSALQFPSISPADIQGAGRSVGGAGMMALQTRVMNAELMNKEAKAVESMARTGLIDIQTQIAKANPMLNQGVVQALSESFISNAQIKASEASMAQQKASFWKEQNWQQSGSLEMTRQSNGYTIMQKELQLLEQKYNLGQADQKIKGEILESKEFQNSILEVQKRFMTEGDITPQHIVAFIQLLLMKLAR